MTWVNGRLHPVSDARDVISESRFGTGGRAPACAGGSEDCNTGSAGTNTLRWQPSGHGWRSKRPATPLRHRSSQPEPHLNRP